MRMAQLQDFVADTLLRLPAIAHAELEGLEAVLGRMSPFKVQALAFGKAQSQVGWRRLGVCYSRLVDLNWAAGGCVAEQVSFQNPRASIVKMPSQSVGGSWESAGRWCTY